MPQGLPSSFQPIDEKDLPDSFETIQDENESPGFFSQVWRALSSPLTTAPSQLASEINRRVEQETGTHLGNESWGQGFTRGALQGIGNLASSFTSPINLALGVAGLGESAAAKSVLGGSIESIPTLLRFQKLRQLASAPVVLHGAGDIVSPESSLSERLQGIPEFAGGMLGLIGGPFVRIANEVTPEGPITPTNYGPKGLPPAPPNTPRFIAGERGVVENNLATIDPTYPLADTFSGTVLPQEFGERTQVQPHIAAQYGNPGGQILTTEERVNRFRNRMNEILNRVPDVELTKPQEPDFGPFPETVETSTYAPSPDYVAPGEEIDYNKSLPEPEVSKTAEDKIYDIARAKHKMGLDLPSSFEPIETPTEIPKEQTFDDMLANFGGAGHPESPDYVSRVLNSVGTGKSGLSIEKGDIGQENLVYRNPAGEPIAVAKIVTDPQGNQTVADLAVDKSKGLLAGRAAVKIGDVLKSRGISEPSGTISPDAINFRERMASKPTAKFIGYQPGFEDQPPVPLYNIEGGNLHGGTVSGETLQKMGIEVPQTPDYEPQEMRVPGVKGKSGLENIAVGGADERVLDILGSSLYSNDRPSVVVKELLQNAFDEHRIAGKTQPIKVLFNKTTKDTKGNPSHSIIIQDYGRGLKPDELYTVFTDVGKTGKGNEAEASGGFGFAKAAPMLGGTDFKAESVVAEGGKKVKYTFGGTKKELINQKKGVELNREIVSDTTPTGLRVTTYFPENTSFYSARDMVGNISRLSPSVTSPVHFYEGYDENPSTIEDFFKINRTPEEIENSSFAPGSYRDTETQKFTKMQPGPVQGEIEIPGAKIKIHHEEPKEGSEEANYKLHLLNKGLYQGSVEGSYGWTAVPNVPRDITADVSATVEEGHEDYPFSANRENVNQATKKAIGKWIDENIVKGANKRRIAQLKAMYNGISSKNTNFNFLDEGNRFTPEELKQLDDNPHFQAAYDSLMDTHLEILDIADKLNWMYGEFKPSVKLKKVGLLFKGGTKEGTTLGIHIPDPENPSESSAILYNLFEQIKAATESDDPLDTLVSGIIATTAHEIAHIPGGGHDTSHSYRDADLRSRIGGKLTKKLIDNLFNVFGDSNGQIKSEILNLLQGYYESRSRPTNSEKNDLLSTGVAAERPRNTSKGKTKNKSNPNGDPTGTSAGPVIQKLLEALKNARPIREDQEAVYSAERSARIGRFNKVKERGEFGAFKRLSKLKGAMNPKFDVEGLQLDQNDVDTLYNAIVDSNRIASFEKAKAITGLSKILNGGHVPQHGELNVLGKVFGNQFPKDIVEMHGGLPFTREVINQSVNLPKSIMASMDLSAPFRQGLPLIYKRQFWTSMDDMIKAFGSEQSFQALQESIRERPLYLLGQESGLQFTDPDDITAQEEAYLSGFAEKIPFVGRYIRASDRAYTGFLNKLRADVFDDLIGEMKRLGYDPNVIGPTLAKFVNVSTGRGSLDKLEPIAKELNGLFFSPRMISSRLTMMNPVYYAKLPPPVRKEALKALLAAVGAGAVFAALLKEAGADVSLNPTSADFGKIKIGNSRLDPYGGFQQYAVAAWRLMTATYTSSTRNRTTKFGVGYKPRTYGTTLQEFAENKLSPVASFIWTMLNRDKKGNFRGRPISVPKEVESRFIPLIIQDLHDLYHDDPDLLPLALPAAFGMNVQTYTNEKPHPLIPELAGYGKVTSMPKGKGFFDTITDPQKWGQAYRDFSGQK